MTCTLGLDISTTASKALLLGEDGTLLGVSSAPHSLSTPRPLWSEQDPLEWWTATRKAVAGVLTKTGVSPEQISGIGLSGQMHGLVLLDEAGDVLRPAMLWNDQRSGAECDEIREMFGLEDLVRITGNDAFPGFTAPKLLWVRNHEPEVYARVRHVLLPKDYIRWRLTGEHATDRAGAGGTLLLDLATRDWSSRILDGLGIPREWLPATHEGTDVTGRLTDSAATATGLASGTPVVGGGGDQAAQAVGVGATEPDTFALTVGTSGVVFAPSDRPRVDTRGRAHAFPHAVPGRWHLMGVMLSAAGSLQWFRDTLAPGVPFDDLVAEAADCPAGADGVTFLPYLTGERTPHADPLATASFSGLTRGHSRGHLTRAVLEGVAFGLLDNLDLLAQAGLPRPVSLRASGGAMQSPLWRQVLADVLATDLVTVDTTEGAALGAAMLAGVGTGIWANAGEASQACVRTGEVIQPSPETVEVYRGIHQRFRALYPALQAVRN
ncbi:MAG: xylulokinase [Rhodothermales bacterium]|nr:xylulokinase [Rhodothermales bacterium]